MKFSTMQEVVDYVELSLGDYSVRFDVDAIVREFVICRDGAYVPRREYESDEGYWDMVARYDRDGRGHDKVRVTVEIDANYAAAILNRAEGLGVRQGRMVEIAMLVFDQVMAENAIRGLYKHGLDADKVLSLIRWMDHRGRVSEAFRDELSNAFEEVEHGYVELVAE